jgi:hypothetical protein
MTARQQVAPWLSERKRVHFLLCGDDAKVAPRRRHNEGAKSQTTCDKCHTGPLECTLEKGSTSDKAAAILPGEAGCAALINPFP